MDLSVDLSFGSPIVRVVGDMRLWGKQEVSDQIRDTLHNLMLRGQRRIVVNMTGVTRIDSRGIGCLARCHATAITSNSEIALVLQPGMVLDVLRQVNFIRLYPVFPTEEAALAAQGASASKPTATTAPPRQ
jgi:anti-anti-sigma factor